MWNSRSRARAFFFFLAALLGPFLSRVGELQDLRLNARPTLSDRLFHGRPHYPLHVAAWCVLGAEAVTLGRIKRASEQGSHYRRLDIRPIASGRLREDNEVLCLEWERGGGGKEMPVKAG